MIGKKLSLVQKGLVPNRDEALLEIPNLEKIKYQIIKGIKKYGHIFLVIILRYYIRSANFLKNKLREIQAKIKSRNQENGIESNDKEMSKFLKVVSDYKKRIREIKHRIKEEEEKDS